MDAYEYAQWIEYFKLEHPEKPADERIALVISAMMNLSPNVKKCDYIPDDFMPTYGAKKVPKREAPEMIDAKLNMYATIHNRKRDN